MAVSIWLRLLPDLSSVCVSTCSLRTCDIATAIICLTDRPPQEYGPPRPTPASPPTLLNQLVR